MKIKKILQATAFVMKLVLYIISLPFTGYWFYRRNCRINRLFCFHMCSHFIFRTVYALIFAGGISAFNLVYVWLTKDFTPTTLTMAVSMLFLSERVSHSILVALNRSNHLLYGLMIISLAAVFTPHMLPFAISLYLLLVAAVFYPSRRAIDNFQSYRGVKFYRKYPALLLAAYFN